MDNQSWDKAKLEEWKNFWDSEMGQEAIKRMQYLREQQINNSMTQSDTGMIAAFVGRAAGIEMVLQDIDGGFNALKQMEKEEEKDKKK